MPELRSRSRETSEPPGDALKSHDSSYTDILERCRETGLLTHLGSTWYTIHPALPWFLRQLFARYYPSGPVKPHGG